MTSFVLRKFGLHSFFSITSKQIYNNIARYIDSKTHLSCNPNAYPNLKLFSTNVQLHAQNEYKVTFIKASGDRITAKGKEGDSLLDVVVNNDLDFDGFGACEGTLTCSTCHCIFKQEDYDKLPEKPSDEELDMLDLAYDLTDTSRLGCQIQLSKELDGVEVRIPATVNDARA